MKILFENEYALISYNSEHGFISLHWKGYVPSAPYREVVTRLYEFRISFQAEGVHKLLSDSRALPTISAADAHWTVELAKKYYNLLEGAKIAVILAEGTFTKLAMDGIQQEFRRNKTDHAEKIESRYFDNLEDATTWLIED